MGDNRSHRVHGYGVISLNLPDGQLKHIHNVMYVPGIKKNLIYVSSVTNNDMKAKFDKYKCHVKDVQDHYMVIAKGSRLGGLYKLNAIKGNHQALTSSAISNVELWHERNGLLDHNDLMLLQKKSSVEGLRVIKDDHIECVACALRKQHRNEFPNHEEKRQIELLELIHTDVCGPMQTR